MEKEKLQRINELARKAKVAGLSEAEKTEQAVLRKAYIAAYRQNLRAQLENIVLVEPDGTERKLKRKEP